jgi:hypothetical protein
MHPTMVVVLLTPVMLNLSGMATGIGSLMLPSDVSSEAWYRLCTSGVNSVLGMGAVGWILSALLEPDPARAGTRSLTANGRGVFGSVRWATLYAVFGVLLALVVNSLMTWVLALLPPLPEWMVWRSAVLEELLTPADPLSLAAQAAGLCLAPAVMEEWVFRRQYGRLLVQLPARRQALMSGATFAVVHTDALMFVPLLAVGVMFWAVAQRGGWHAAAVTHFAFNATGIFIWFRVEPALSSTALLPVIALGSGALLAVCWRSTSPPQV